MFLKAIQDGGIKGIKTSFMLLKIVLPVYLTVVIIKYSPIMPFLQTFFEPGMGIFGLPGDGIIPIVTGFFTDEYGVVASLKSLDLTSLQITTVAVITLTAHSLPVEFALAKKIGFSPLMLTSIRILTAIFLGILVGLIGGVL